MKHEKGERKDVVVTPNPISVNLTEGLEGDRSKCCYAPAKVKEGTVRPSKPVQLVHECTKCGKECVLLTEKEKRQANKKAREAINKLFNRTCVVTVLYKPTNDFVASKVKVPHVRKFAEAAVKKYTEDHPKLNIRIEDFVLVENEGDQIRVTALKITPKQS